MRYQAPLQDFQFLLNECWSWNEHWNALHTGVEMDAALQEAVLLEAARFCSEVLAPINRNGDEEACQFEQGLVKTPKGFVDAWRQFAESGWQSLSGDPAYGGQGLPLALKMAVEEMIYAANTSFCLYSSLSHGATEALVQHAPESLRNCFVPKLISGQWAGAMCLTEPHSGTDLGLLKTRAQADGNGAYTLQGTKIFITGGEHDLTENIIHLVLARLPDAPAGSRGISLFLVPKFLVDETGNLGERNAIHCGSIEHKMGIKASSTCVMNLDGATGYLVGAPHEGLKCMFTMMNAERISIGMQGVGLGEMSWQLAARYASERKQGKAIGSGAQADPIIVHADVQRMLLTMRAYVEAGRALALWLGTQQDLMHHGDEHQREHAETLIAYATPIAKAFSTDRGFEVCNLGMQVLGGHGYIREWGLEQLVRDARIAQIYEGTNGVQALDLVGRKLLANNGAMAGLMQHEMNETLEKLTDADWRLSFAAALQAWQTATQHLLSKKADKSAGSAEANAYLQLTGHVVYGWFWAQMNECALGKTERFYVNKRLTADFYRRHLLTQSHHFARQILSDAHQWLTPEADYYAV